MVTIQIDEQTAERIEARAQAMGLSVSEYVKCLVPNEVANPTETPPRLDVTKFFADIEELSIDGPVLPADFSRADIYSDHD